MSVIKTEEPNLTTPNSFDSKVFELMKQVNRLQNQGNGTDNTYTKEEIDGKIEEVKSEVNDVKSDVASVQSEIELIPEKILNTPVDTAAEHYRNLLSYSHTFDESDGITQIALGNVDTQTSFYVNVSLPYAQTASFDVIITGKGRDKTPYLYATAGGSQPDYVKLKLDYVLGIIFISTNAENPFTKIFFKGMIKDDYTLDTQFLNSDEVRDIEYTSVIDKLGEVNESVETKLENKVDNVISISAGRNEYPISILNFHKTFDIEANVHLLKIGYTYCSFKMTAYFNYDRPHKNIILAEFNGTITDDSSFTN